MSSSKFKGLVSTRRFKRFLDNLAEKDVRKIELVDAIKILKENYLQGNNIRRDLWPQIYVKKYGITNLRRFPLRSGWRLIYTIKGEDSEIVICLIEALSHQEYEKRFGY